MTSANYTAVKALIQADPLTDQQTAAVAELLRFAPSADRWLTETVVADRISVSARQVQRWGHEGCLRTFRFSRRCVRYSERSVEEFIRAYTAGGEPARNPGEVAP